MSIKVWDHQRIIELYKAGYSTARIRHDLKLDVSIRQIQRIVKQAGLSQRRMTNGRLSADQYNGPLRDIVIGIMMERGLDPYLCAECGQRQQKHCQIHHTKYAGATIADLRFLCQSCNLAPHNIGLA